MTAVKGIIFDMDNTLLRSRIDFTALKLDLFRYLVSAGAVPEDLPIDRHTSSTLIEHALRQEGLPDGVREEVWRRTAFHELAGMLGADLEPGAAELLEELHGRFVLTVLTNNAQAAAEAALNRNGIAGFFERIVGREPAREMKPSPAGVRYLLAEYPALAADEWLAVGDAWIDGAAAQEAGVPFVAYRGDAAKMRDHGVTPVGEIAVLGELIRFL